PTHARAHAAAPRRPEPGSWRRDRAPADRACPRGPATKDHGHIPSPGNGVCGLDRDRGREQYSDDLEKRLPGPRGRSARPSWSCGFDKGAVPSTLPGGGAKRARTERLDPCHLNPGGPVACISHESGNPGACRAAVDGLASWLSTRPGPDALL